MSEWGTFENEDGTTRQGRWVDTDDGGKWFQQGVGTNATPWKAFDSKLMGGTDDYLRSGFLGGKSLVTRDPGGLTDEWRQNEFALKEGFDAYGYRTDKSQIPELSDFFNVMNAKHKEQYGESYNRPWEKNGESGLRDSFINDYTTALGEYNQLYGTNLQANQQAINRFGKAPTWYAASDPSASRSGGVLKGGLGQFLLTAAGGMFAPYLSTALGGGMMGNAGAGAIMGGLRSGVSGGDVLSGAISGGLSGGMKSLDVASLTGGGNGMFDIGDMDFSSQFGDMGGGFDISGSDFEGGGDFDGADFGGDGGDFTDWDIGDPMGQEGDFDFSGGNAPFTMGNIGYGPEGDTGAFPTIQGGLDQITEPQPNFGGPGFPDGAGLPDAWKRALSSAGFRAVAGAGAGTLVEQIRKFISNPDNLRRGGGAIANLLIQNRTSRQLRDAAERAAERNQTINQPQRLPYQQMLAEQMNNPSQFLSTNPVIQGQLNMAKNQMEANTAKMGAGGKVFGDYLGHMNNIMSDNFYKNADLLSRLGGFNDGAGGAGSIFGQLSGQAAQAGGAGFQGFSQFFNPQQQDPQISALLKQISDKASQIFL